MIDEKTEIIINEYFDGELDKKKEPYLFTLLAEDLEAREYFKSLNLIKEVSNETAEEFPMELEEKLFHSFENIKPNYNFKLFDKSFASVFSYALAMVLLVFSIFMFSKVNSYEDNLNITIKQIENQNKTIELLYNSLPVTEIKDKPMDEIIIQTSL